ncbi:MAG: dephospho-CoA kinase [Peptostreptococcaceae bacterium]|nr:dephospho-CoA kinase [Peptostreptococcaceae bacterium]MDY5738571.1 dephospho-CoA kinase [Anaerovoracaceae bacterium]
MIIIGITGGIGSGKSTVSGYLSDLGYTVIDADKISREITESDNNALLEIRRDFGVDVFNSDDTLNRKALANIVFSESSKKRILEGIVISRAEAIIKEKISALKASHSEKKAVFLDAPLLLETGMNRLTDKVWLCDALDEIRIQRVMSRDGLKREEIIARMKNQMSREEKIKFADDVIENNLGREELLSNIERLLSKYDLK